MGLLQGLIGYGGGWMVEPAEKMSSGWSEQAVPVLFSYQAPQRSYAFLFVWGFLKPLGYYPVSVPPVRVISVGMCRVVKDQQTKTEALQRDWHTGGTTAQSSPWLFHSFVNPRQLLPQRHFGDGEE